MRGIDGDALEELFREVIGGIAKKPEMDGNLEHMVRASAMVIEMIQDAPTIEPECKKGKWIKHIDDLFPAESTLECSMCHHEQPITIDDNYCPNCGARMEGEG